MGCLKLVISAKYSKGSLTWLDPSSSPWSIIQPCQSPQTWFLSWGKDSLISRVPLRFTFFESKLLGSYIAFSIHCSFRSLVFPAACLLPAVTLLLCGWWLPCPADGTMKALTLNQKTTLYTGWKKRCWLAHVTTLFDHKIRSIHGCGIYSGVMPFSCLR